jgi:hypothetical protein
MSAGARLPPKDAFVTYSPRVRYRLRSTKTSLSEQRVKIHVFGLGHCTNRCVYKDK